MTSIPFRFKASSGMAPESFHHRRSSQNTHKPFKSRHATKSLLKELSKGKIDGIQQKRHRKTPHQQVMSKIDRRNHAKQMRQIKQQQNDKSTSVFAGVNGAPRIVTVVPLSADVDTQRAIEKLTDAADAEAQWPLGAHVRVRVDRFKQNLMFVPVKLDLLDALDMCRVADFVVFLLSPDQEPDEQAQVMLRTIEGQGVGNVIAMVQDQDRIENSKKRAQWTFGLKTWITRFFPEQEKVPSLDYRSECANAVRSLCTTTPKGVRWREDRSWMLVDEVRWPETVAEQDAGEVILTGVVRGKGLKADRLVQVGDWGSFQIDKITNATPPTAKKKGAEKLTMAQPAGSEDTLQEPSAGREDLDELAPYEASMDDVDDLAASEAPSERKGVLLDDHHYFSDENKEALAPPKRLPKGTSNYQSAWFLGDESDSASDYEDMVDNEGDLSMDSPALPQDGIEGLAPAPIDQTETGSEYPASEMFLDPSPAQEAVQIEEYRKSRKDEAKEDLEFPDEIELHPNVLARERLARYRGLKSLKTSTWDTSEDRAHEPEDWSRLLQIPDYKRARKQAENDALVGGVQPGTRVNVHLHAVPLSLRQAHNPGKPVSLHSLLRHEHKRSVVNVSITLSSAHLSPLKSKDEVIMQCGPRRFIINPLFSQLGSTPNDVHKFLRYLQPGQTAVATFMGPVTWGSVPCLFFTRSSSPSQPLTLIGTGTTLPPSTTRIVAKRVILTGHPFKIHRKLVTVRYMFFNKEDVAWFKALQLWTKRGRMGFIKESLGTHGYFKATFDGKVNSQDSVGVSLYKRVWPRQARVVKPGDLGVAARVADGEEGEQEAMTVD